MTKYLVGLFAALMLAGCGSGAKATGPSAPIVLICNEDDQTNDADATASSGTSIANNCDKSVSNPPAVEAAAKVK